MTASQRKIAHRLRFVCIACRFEVNPSPGVTYAGANRALGLYGWRIEQRQLHGSGKTWGPVCNICATPDPKQEMVV